MWQSRLISSDTIFYCSMKEKGMRYPSPYISLYVERNTVTLGPSIFCIKMLTAQCIHFFEKFDLELGSNYGHLNYRFHAFSGDPKTSS